MSSGEIAFLVLVIGTLLLFACVLAWAQWMESKERKAAVSRTVDESVPAQD